MMNYKGYIGFLRVDEDAGVLRGKVINTRDTITFQGKTVAEAKTAFRDSVDDYLEYCESLGEAPEKPFSGRFVVRIKPELHRRLAVIAQAKGQSLNKLITHQLHRLARRAGPPSSPAKAVETKRNQTSPAARKAKTSAG